MIQPNWFDKEFADSIGQPGRSMSSQTAEQVLMEIAQNPRIIQAVRDALANFDTNSMLPGWVGPSRTQAVRQAIIAVLQED